MRSLSWTTWSGTSQCRSSATGTGSAGPGVSVALPGALRHADRRLLVAWEDDFLSTALKHESVGLENVADGEWLVFFGDVLLGKFLEAESRVTVGLKP